MTAPLPAFGLPRVPSEVVMALARRMRIVQLDGGATALWEPNYEQDDIWRARDEHHRRYVTKSRRMGGSVALDFERVLNVDVADHGGHRIRAAIILPTEDKVKERIAQCASFASQMNFDVDVQTMSIKWKANGSEIVGITAGGDTTSRGEGFQHATWEEYAFLKPGAYGEISPSIGKGAVETICTTIDVGATNGIAARDMWRDKNGYHKMFFPFEKHEGYRGDPKAISDERWEWAQAQGFTRRDSAAYWLTELLANKCENDVMRCFREYPPTEDKMFSSSASKWVSITPAILDPIDVFTVLGIRGDDWPVLVYKKLEDCGPLLIGVDTAQGKGMDKGVSILVDQRDWSVAAMCVSDRILFDDLARVTLEIQQRYTRDKRAPTAIIEEQGCGDATITSAQGIGVHLDVHTPTEDTKYRGLLMAKMAVESGLLRGPKELGIECDELHRDPVTGAFKGRKDILSAYGFCALRMSDAPWLPKQPVRKLEERVDIGRAIRQIQRQQRAAWQR